MSGHAVLLEAVSFRYDAGDVLRDVSLSLPAGSSVALLGPNGAGKTTLTRLLVGLRRPRVGRVLVGDWDVARKRPDEMARRVGYAFQHADQQLFARTVADDVAFGPRRLGLSLDGVAPVLEELGLAGVARRHPYDLPAPLRKLVALAGVLAMRPGVLVLDEPTAGFGAAARGVVVAALLRRLAEGITVLSVSHDLEFVAETAERIVVLERGRVAAERPAAALLRDAAALDALGLRAPTPVRIGLALGLKEAPVREADVVAALAGICWRGA
jgi:energy-coupling factor transport system ATP-binding protein